MSFFDSLSPKEFIILANLVAIALLKDKTLHERQMLSNFVATVGAIMLSISTQQQHLEFFKSDTKKQIENLQRQIDELKNNQ